MANNLEKYLSTIPGIVTHFDANRINGDGVAVPGNGEIITTFTNLSGALNLSTGATSNIQYKKNGINGNSCIFIQTYSGGANFASSGMTLVNPSTITIDRTKELHVFVAQRRIVSTGNGAPVYIGGMNTASGYVFVSSVFGYNVYTTGFNPGTSVSYERNITIRRSPQVGGTIDFSVVTASFNLNTAKLLRISQGINLKELNYMPAPSANSTGDDMATFNASNFLSLSVNSPFATTGVTAELYEILLINSTLTTELYNKVQSYFKLKYNI